MQKRSHAHNSHPNKRGKKYLQLEGSTKGAIRRTDLAAEGDPLDVHRHGPVPARFRHCSLRRPPASARPPASSARLVSAHSASATARGRLYIRRRSRLLLGWSSLHFTDERAGGRGVKLTGWVVVPLPACPPNPDRPDARLFRIGLVAAALALVAVRLTSGPMLSLSQSHTGKTVFSLQWCRAWFCCHAIIYDFTSFIKIF